MLENVGAKDRSVRTAVGAVAGTVSLALLTGMFAVPAVVSPVLGVGSLVMLGTAATGSCPAYSLLGLDTCPRDAGQ